MICFGPLAPDDDGGPRDRNRKIDGGHRTGEFCALVPLCPRILTVFLCSAIQVIDLRSRLPTWFFVQDFSIHPTHK